MTSPTAGERGSSQIEELQVRNLFLEQSLASRTRELEVYQAVQQAINRQLERENVLQMIADQARLLTRCSYSVVYLLEEEQGEQFLRLAVISGDLHSDIRPGYRLPLDQSVAGQAIRDQKPYCVQDARKDPRVYEDAVQRSNVRSFLIVPLISGKSPLGVISVADITEGKFSEEEERIMSLLASSVIISLENARLYAQAGEIAVMNERNRLARELHDAVTQSLFSASLIGDVLPTLWEEDPQEGRQRLQELRRLTRGALAEMRTLLLELRPAALENASLQQLLRHLINAFNGRSQIPVQFRMEAEPAHLAALPVGIKVGVYRIAQEALNNIFKHAEAENVLLHLRAGARSLRMQVQDDGKGFDPSSEAGGGLGLGIMKERAQAIGAVLTINSQVGEGTQVVFTWEKPGESLSEPEGVTR
jgi:signal transduction histidine kinase